MRWFIDQLETSRSKVEARAGASLDKISAWSESAATTPRVTVRKPRRAAAFQQAELWPAANASAETATPEAAAGEVDMAPAAMPVEHMSFMPAVEKETLARPRTLSRRIVTPSTPARRPAGLSGKPGGHIARFLNVNGAIEGTRTGGLVKYDLPGRALSKALRFWKSPDLLTGFSPAYH